MPGTWQERECLHVAGPDDREVPVVKRGDLGAMPRPGCTPVSFCPARRAVATRLSPTKWHGCQFSLVRGHRTRNGIGKTTTMRVILGLEAPTSGTALVGGRRYQEIIRPLRQVGSLLDAARRARRPHRLVPP